MNIERGQVKEVTDYCWNEIECRWSRGLFPKCNNTYFDRCRASHGLVDQNWFPGFERHHLHRQYGVFVRPLANVLNIIYFKNLLKYVLTFFIHVFNAHVFNAFVCLKHWCPGIESRHFFNCKSNFKLLSVLPPVNLIQ